MKSRVNESFFENWSNEMAYVVGFFCADGSMFINPRGSKYVAFYSTDKELILKIRRVLNSKNKIGIRKRSYLNWKKLCSLQIGSAKMYADLLKLGLIPNKAKRLSLPDVPSAYLGHFIRGYFDGDGCISFGYYKRKNSVIRNKFSLLIRFASGSRNFLGNLSKKLSLAIDLKGGSIFKNTGGFHLSYSKKDSVKLFNFMYNRDSCGLYLKRKFNKFQKAFKIRGAVA